MLKRWKLKCLLEVLLKQMLTNIDINSYDTIIFDCDGVVLNSNHIKTDAFYKTVLPYGENAAEEFVNYHILNGGVSRYEKFKYFLREVAPEQEGPGFDELIETYASYVVEGLMTCKVAEGIGELRERTSGANWLIASGGDQLELRSVFQRRNLSSLFNKGIYGSPEKKEVILKRELNDVKTPESVLFIGDSKYDWSVSQTVNIDFLFLSQWSEVEDWRAWVKKNNIKHLASLSLLLKS